MASSYGLGARLGAAVGAPAAGVEPGKADPAGANDGNPDGARAERSRLHAAKIRAVVSMATATPNERRWRSGADAGRPAPMWRTDRSNGPVSMDMVREKVPPDRAQGISLCAGRGLTGTRLAGSV